MFGGVMKLRPRLLAGLLVAVALGAAGCGGSGGSGGGSDKLTLVAYSTPREAYEALIPAFQKTDAGKGVRVSQSYGGSGDQARAVQNGLAGDVVALSLEPDMTKLVEAGLVAKDWNADSHEGITPNPFTSGGARWNVMAAYGAQLEQGKSPEQAVAYLEQLFRNVPVQDKSARESLQTFVGGKGDVMIAYENEAITAQQKEQNVDYVMPDQTILIENPIAVTTKSKNPAKAKAFLDYLLSAKAQQVFVQKGYRPVNEQVAATVEFPTPSGLFTIKDLGGWSEVNKKFFDKKAGIMADIEHKIGVSIGN